MSHSERRTGYAALWVLALAVGWIEGSVVVYLREIYARTTGARHPVPAEQVEAVETMP
jgi:hypothetical protein